MVFVWFFLVMCGVVVYMIRVLVGNEEFGWVVIWVGSFIYFEKMFFGIV